MTNTHTDWKTLLKSMKLEYIENTAPGFYELSGGNKMQVKPYTDKTANGLTKCIVDFIKFSGGDANRINTQGQMRKIGGRMVWTHGSTRKGTADIHAIYSGRHISVEIKIGKDSQSDYQKKEQERIINAGGLYWIAKDFPSFLSAWTTAGFQIKHLKNA